MTSPLLDTLSDIERKMVDHAFQGASLAMQTWGEIINSKDELVIKEAIAISVLKGRRPDGSRVVDVSRLWM